MATAVRSTPVMAARPVMQTVSASKASPLAASKATVFGARVAPVALARASGRTALSVVARDAAWAPGSEAPAHLDGSLAGDFGFDPLGLGKDPETLAWYRQAEIVHCRFAMLGVAGILLPDLLAKTGFSWAGAGVPWYEAGEFSYFAPTGAIFVSQLLLMGWAEARRWLDIKNPGSVNKDPIFGSSLPDGVVGYPGGIFDPMGYASKGGMEKQQLKEIKNGRLAMMAMLGFYAQHQVCEGTPVDQWFAHLADPWNTTVLSNMSDVFVWDWAAPSSTLSALAPLAATAGKP